MPLTLLEAGGGGGCFSKISDVQIILLTSAKIDT